MVFKSVDSSVSAGTLNGGKLLKVHVNRFYVYYEIFKKRGV